MTQTPEITWKSWLMVATLGLTWGATFLIIELALEDMTPFWLAFGRIGFAALVSAAIWQALGRPLFHAPTTPATRLSVFLIGGFSAAIPFSLLAWGQQYTTSSFAGVSMASVGLIILPLAHLFIPGERMTLRRVTGFSIGLVGVGVLIGGQAFETSGASLEWAGRMACVGAACCYAISSVLMRRLPAVDPIGLSTVLLIIAACMTAPLALIREGWPPLPSAQNLWIIAFLGLVPTAAANLLRVLVIRSAGPVFMSLTNYQAPVWAVALGAWLLSEPLPPTLLLAMALILFGSALSQWGALTRLFARRSSITPDT